MKKDLTVTEMILLAANNLMRLGFEDFSAEQLVVEAYEKYPKQFGLKGFVDKYPNSNKVLSTLMGKKGLAQRDLLLKLGSNRYATSYKGRRLVNALLKEPDEVAVASSGVNYTLDRDQSKFVKNCTDSIAYQKFSEGHKNEMTFADACRFWDIKESTQRKDLDAALDSLNDKLRCLQQLVLDDRWQTKDGTPFSDGDLRVIINLHSYLEERFERHLNLLRGESKRSDRKAKYAC